VKELTECLDTKRKINKKREKIQELRMRILSPKNQIITGMPFGGGSTENAVDKYLVTLERLEKQEKALKNYQKKQWKKACEKIGDISEQNKELLYLRFMKGYQWKKCVIILNDKYGRWSVNKAFYIYGKINKKS
jgi:hypothetical protein